MRKSGTGPFTTAVTHRSHWGSRWMLLPLVALVVAVCSLLPAGRALADSTPPAPAAPTQLFLEDFENDPPAGDDQQLLSSYVGAAPQSETYTASPDWISASQCNGIVTDATSPNITGYCDDSGEAAIHDLAYALGLLSDPSDPGANHALSAWTSNAAITGGDTELQTNQSIPISGGTHGRYILFSVNAAAVSCEDNQPQYQFNLLDGTQVIPAFTGTSTIDPCTASQAMPFTYMSESGYYGSFPSDQGVLFTGSSLGIQLINTDTSPEGNDAAIDNIQVLDGTPQLEKNFSASSANVNAPVTLTYTITNTTDLAEKDGWSFTDSLPSGLVVASSPNTSSTCGSPTITAAAGATSITGGGDLAAGQASCTISVDVTSSTAGGYTNDASNITSYTGLVPPTYGTSVQFVQADLQQTNTLEAPGLIPGDDATYHLVITNPNGPDTAAAGTDTDALPAGLTFVSSDTGCTSTDGTNVSCPVSAIAMGGQAVEDITVAVPSTLTGSVQDCATVTSPTEDPDLANNTACSTNTATPEFDLSVAKSLEGGAGLTPGVDGTYDLVATDNGPSASPATTITDALPAGETFVSSSTGCTVSSGVVSCPVSALAAGASVTDKITVAVSAAATSAIENCATIVTPAGGTDPTAGNNTSCDTEQVHPLAQLTAAKSVISPTGGTVIAGDQISYRITVGNTGPSDAQNAMVTDSLPASLDASSATATVTKQPAGNTGSCTISGAAVSCSLGRLPVGSDLVEVTVTATVLASDTGSSITNAAHASTTTPDNTTGAPNALVTGSSTEAETQQAQLTVTNVVTNPSQSPSATPVIAGNAANYTITVGNTGPSDAQGTVVTEQLPPQFDPSTAVVTVTNQPAGNIGSCSVNQTSGLITCTLGTLPVGSDLAQISVSATVNASDTSSSISDQACGQTSTDNSSGDPNVKVCATAPLAEVQRQLVTSIKAASSTSVVAGNQISYTITVANQGPSNAADSVVSDPLPTSLDPSTAVATITKQPAGNSGSCSVDASTGVVTCALGSLPVGSDLVEISVTATVLPSDTGSSITNTACTTTSTPDANSGLTGMDYCGSSTIQELQESALTVAKTVSSPAPPAAVIAGDQVTYEITVGNQGPSDAQNAAVSDALPASLNPATATVSIVAQPAGNTGSCAISASSGVISCALGTLPVGSGLVVISVTATVKSSDTGSSISNQACANTSTPDPTTGTTGSRYCGSATIGESQQDNLSLQKLALTSPGVPGAHETYQLQVTNSGPSDAQNVKVTDPLPAGTSFVSASGGCTAAAGTVTCTDADLPATAGGNVIAWNVTVLIDSAQTGSSTNTATVTSTTPDANPNNTATVTIPLSAQTDLTVLKKADEPTVAVGSDEGYTLTVTNHGPSDAKNVVVTDPLPAGLKFVSASKGCGDQGQTVTCTDPVLSAKAGKNVVTFKLTVYVEPTVSANIVNTATVTTSTAESVPAGSTPGGAPVTRKSTARNTAVFPALKLTNTASKAKVPNGGEVTYTLVLKNIGKGTAFGVKLCDRIPVGATLVSAKGAHLMNGDVCWTVAELRAGGKTVKTITLKMAAKTLTGKVTDPATATAINTKAAKAKALVTVGPAPGPTPEGVTG